MKLAEELERLEITQTPGNGLFVLYFSTLFPYMDQDRLDMDASLSTYPKECGEIINLRDNSVLNSRRPDKIWVVMAQKFGRKISKAGCILQLPHEELAQYKWLNLTYSVDASVTRMSVPISIHTQDRKPCAAVTVHLRPYELDDPGMTISIYERKRFGWGMHTWYQDSCDWGDRLGITRLTPREQDDWLVYNETVETIPQRVDDVIYS